MNKKDWDDSILKRPGTVFGDIAIREEQRQKKEQRDVSMMTQEMARRNGNSRPWSREKSLGLLGAIGAVATAAAFEVAWPWYVWAVLFFGVWCATSVFFSVFQGLAKMLVLLIQITALAGVGYFIYSLMQK